ncbi:coniferyl aldehyde dehydrogenase [Parasphingopyxis sp.]|uniref:coniferyl aldehyde dehydrogenase n=1 Tax=Parasphingopyxis sp. TaxID=1920299 RepID=UPI002626233D|nr:coniferyl aldehyde dehydrogenase [Parasphingopyxis sp.]
MNIAQSASAAIDLELADSKGDMDRLFEVQRAAFKAETHPSATVRKDRLRRLLHLLVDNEQRIMDAAMADFGYRSPQQSFFVEVVTTAKPIKEAIKKVGRWMKPEKRSVDAPFRLAGARAEVRYQPLGVVGGISPWNFPFNLSFAPLAGILAAGNRAIIKPSEATPVCAALIAELVAASYDENEVAVINGGPDVARAFTALPFDHLLYTGGEAVAKHVMRAAADNLTPVTLELGGKSPVLIGKGANMRLAAERVIFGKMLNAGQICLAPDHIFVPEDGIDDFVTALKDAVRKTAPEDRKAADFVSIVNDRHAERLRSYIADARTQGAEIVSFDWLGEGGDNLVPLTLILNPDEKMDVMQEEIFGPLLPIKSYRSLDDVFAYMAGQSRPLAIYYFGSDDGEIRAVLENTQSGGVTINDVIMHYTIDTLPFGGVGASGMGAYHGFDGFKQFSHARAIYRQSPFDIGGALRPPYGRTFERVSRFLLKHG